MLFYMVLIAHLQIWRYKKWEKILKEHNYC